MPLNDDEMKAFYVRQLRILNNAAKNLADPQGMAFKINKKLSNEGDGGLRFIEQIVANRFKMQTDENGTPWASLTSATQKQRVRFGFPGPAPILRRSGTLARAATFGRVTVFERGVGMIMRDDPAPKYIGGGGYRRGNIAKNGTVRSRHSSSGGRLAEYAGALNFFRPFYGKPTRKEMEPMIKRRDEIIRLVYQAILNGIPLGQVL